MVHKGENYSVKLQKYFFATEPELLITQTIKN
jgi:hypothetical protein